MKPTLIEVSLWEREYYSLRQSKMTKQEYINFKKRNWYREQYKKGE